jgi:hypothetical protein
MPMNPRLLRPLSRGWLPRREAGLEFWLDAADTATITLNSGNVSEWRDKSGKARHGTQATAGSQPAYGTNTLNGRNLVLFDGSDDFIDIPAIWFRGVTAPFTLCYFFLRRGAGTGSDTYRPSVTTTTTSPLSDQGGFHYLKNTTNAGASYFQYQTWGNYDLASGSYANGTAYMIRYSTDATNWRVFVNGTQEGTTGTKGNAPVNTTEFFTLARQRSSPVRTSNIDMGEVFLLTNPTTGANERAEGYLAWKWGFASSLPANHPYKNSPPL